MFFTLCFLSKERSEEREEDWLEFAVCGELPMVGDRVRVDITEGVRWDEQIFYNISGDVIGREMMYISDAENSKDTKYIMFIQF